MTNDKITKRVVVTQIRHPRSRFVIWASTFFRHWVFRISSLGRGRAALLMLCVVVTVSAVQTLRPTAVVRADVTSEPPRDQFKAGGERSEIVLREILSVLKKMDARLEHIEKAAGDAAKASRPTTKSSTSTHKETGTP